MASNPPSARRHRLLNGILLGLSVTLSASLAIYVIRHVGGLEAFIRRLGLLGPLISIGLQALFGASPIPTEPLTMLNGALFGPWLGAFYSWIGYMLAAEIEYFIGTDIRQVSDFETHRSHLPFGLGRLPANSPWFLILVRAIPGYGPKMVGIVSGMYRVSLWRFTWTAAIPNAVGALAFALGGAELRSLLY